MFLLYEHICKIATDYGCYNALIVILILPPGVVCSSNGALTVLGTADGDAVSRCQVLGRAGSVHHGGRPVGVAWSA